ncbi:unnamed protein product [Moneuplotes crassus]|uniref:Uncharacterized protein n=1 Tax=Euplotes crassus TaxID=5936 RepID=A0AAD1UJA5_EUPCR|nr:unnamed protein product [Moneuplotes crassus]
MEIGRKCQAKGCSNEAIYFHKDFKVYICSVHCKPSQRAICVKIGERAEVDSIKDMLKVLETCTKNLWIAGSSIENNAKFEFSELLVRQILDETDGIEKEIKVIQQKHQYENLNGVKQELRKILTYLKNNEIFQQFCVENYISLVCDFLKVNKSKIGQDFDLQINETNEMSHNEEVRDITDKYEHVKQEFQTFKKRVITMLNPTTLEGLGQSIEIFKRKKSNIETSKKFQLDFENSEDLEFVNCMGSNIIANLEDFRIHRISDNLQTARDFIFSSFPQKANCLYFNFCGKMINSDEIIDVLCFMNPKIGETLYLYNLEVSQSQMRTLFQLTKDNEKFLGFPCCKLELDTVPNLKHCLIGSKIQTLVLSYCGMPEYCDWKTYPERFENLIKGLSQSEDFVSNLQSFRMKRCGMPLDQVREILDANNFEKAKISDHSE